MSKKEQTMSLLPILLVVNQHLEWVILSRAGCRNDSGRKDNNDFLNQNKKLIQLQYNFGKLAKPTLWRAVATIPRRGYGPTTLVANSRK
ncbi:hypothetical protein EVAR_20004_1 [Eumeta japonica]|uniref:Uncharacterized protein n=1 Tax=Eumeta variegata TaxID=151549 RepID=A0A4C1VC13_EUMVA|nr:hypothetical protein EVAR_20004_1 [Eumeta japonica]